MTSTLHDPSGGAAPGGGGVAAPVSLNGGNIQFPQSSSPVPGSVLHSKGALLLPQQPPAPMPHTLAWVLAMYEHVHDTYTGWLQRSFPATLAVTVPVYASPPRTLGAQTLFAHAVLGTLATQALVSGLSPPHDATLLPSSLGEGWKSWPPAAWSPSRGHRLMAPGASSAAAAMVMVMAPNLGNRQHLSASSDHGWGLDGLESSLVTGVKNQGGAPGGGARGLVPVPARAAGLVVQLLPTRAAVHGARGSPGGIAPTSRRARPEGAWPWRPWASGGPAEGHGRGASRAARGVSRGNLQCQAPPCAPAMASRAAALVALATLAPALAALPGSAQQVQLQTDLEALEVFPGTPRVNQTDNVTALVRNLGVDNALTFSVLFGWGNSSTPLADNAGNSTVSYPTQQQNFWDPRNETGEPDELCLAPSTGLKKGCSVRANFNWTPPLSRKGPGNLSAKALPGVPYGDPVPGNNEARNATFVVHHQLALELDAGDDRDKQVRPGDAAFYRVTVRNHGNLEELVLLGIRSDQWGNASMTEPLLRVPVGGSARVLALLTAPEEGDALAAANVTANATAAPELGSAKLALPETQRVEGLQVSYGLAVEAPADASVAPGGETNLTVQVRNTGGTEDALRWSLSPMPAGWSAGFVEPWLGAEGPADARSPATLRITASPSLGPGSSAVLSGQAIALNTGAQVPFNVTLRTLAPDLELVALKLDRDAVYQGDDVLVQADVANRGQAPLPKPARLTVDAVQSTGRVAVGEQLVSGLGPGESRSLLVRWATGSMSGPVELVATIDPDGDIAEVSEDNNARNRSLVVRLHGLEWVAPPARSARPGELLEYKLNDTFAVRNLGNAAEEVVVEFSTERGWTNATARLQLAPGALAAVPLQLQVPGRPGTLVEQVSAEASLVNRSATRATAGSNVSIVDREPPVLERLEAPEFVELGHAAEFRAVLRDAVGVRSAELRLRLPDGDLRTEPLHFLRLDTWEATIVLAQPGAVSYWVRAVDATPFNNTLDTGNAQRALLVGVRSSPLVELLEPRNNSVVRSGTLLKLRITDVHGIGSVAVRDGDRTFELEEPYAIPTAGLEEGLHVFEVTARNRFGNPTTERFHVTLDDTPPLLQDGRVLPPRPEPGQDFEVEARASQDVRVAVVQVLRDAKLVREVPARAGLGLVTANLSIAEAGRYTLAVRVEDAAGNAATLDLPVQVGRGLPGFEAALLLAATGLAAVTRLRRKP